MTAKMPDMVGHKRVQRHILLDEETWLPLFQESQESCGGNTSFLLRKILRERYKIESKWKL